LYRVQNSLWISIYHDTVE